MATKKVANKTYTITGTFNNLQIGVEVQATSLEEAVAKSKDLKFSNFISECEDVHDYEGPEITAIWKNN